MGISSPLSGIPAIQSRILILAVAVVLIVGTAVSAVILIPIRNDMIAYAEGELLHDRDMRKTMVSQYLLRVCDVAEQITSRTRIRQELARFRRGEVSLQELKAFTVPKLKDAMALTRDIVGITRLDTESVVVASVGEPIPAKNHTIPNDGRPHFLGPTEIDSRWRMIVAAPIVDPTAGHVGADVVAFRLETLAGLLDDQISKVAGHDIRNARARLIHDGRTYAATADRSGLEPADLPFRLQTDTLVQSDHDRPLVVNGRDGSAFVLTAAMMPKPNWMLLVFAPRDDLVSGVGRTLTLVGAALALLVALGALGAWLLIRPLTGKARTTAENLEDTLASQSTDIERQEARNRTIESMNARLGRIIEKTQEEIFLFDCDSLRFIDVNRGARRNLGYMREEIRELTPLDIVYGISPEAFRDRLAPLLRGEREQIDLKAKHRRKDGSTYDVETSLQIIRTETPPVFVALANDVTRRKFMERQLLIAQRMEAVGQLTGGIAHEFNNLLQVIRSSLDVLQIHYTSQEPATTILANALHAGDRGAELTQQLLAYSRRQLLQPSRVDPSALVHNLANLLDRTIGETITIRIDAEKSLGMIEVDPGAFETALLNIALNARAAMPTGGDLHIRTEHKTLDVPMDTGDGILPTGNYAAIIVSDTGVGMSAEVLSHAFEPFFTTRNIGEGSGLGLSMVFGFVRQSGGYVTLESTPGEGTTVRILLPLVEVTV